MGSFSITHWLILLVVVVIVFGTSKLRNAGKDLGGAVKGFKEAVKDEDLEHQKKHRVLNHDISSQKADGVNAGTRVDEVATPISTDNENPKV